jgi:hypothetical protein
VLFRHASGDTVEKHGNSHSELIVSRPIFEPSTSQIRDKSFAVVLTPPCNTVSQPRRVQCLNPRRENKTN